MARQGNYVSVPGGDANWSKGISGSLADLSKSLIAQGNTEAERLRLAENERQRMLEGSANRVDTLMEREKADARAAADRALQAERDRLTAEDRAARLALLQAKDARDAETHVQTVADTERARTDASTIGNFDVTTGVEILGPNAQSVLGTTREGLSAQEADVAANIATINERRGFLTPEGGLSAEGQAEFDRRYAILSQALPAEEARTRAMAQVTTMRDNALASDYETQATTYLERQREDLATAESRLPALATVEEYVQAGIDQLVADGTHSAPRSAAVREELTARARSLGLKTADELVSAGQAADVAAYERAKEQANLFNDYYTRRQAAEGSGSRTASSGMDAAEFNDFISNLDGWGQEDKQQAITLLTNLSQDPAVRAQNIPIGVLREAILLTSFEGALTDNRTADPENPADVTKVVELAQALNSGRTTGRTFIDKTDYTLPDVNARSRADILGGRVTSALPQRTGRLPEMYTALAMPDLTALQAEVADRNLAAQAAAEEEAAVAREALATTAAAKADAIQAGDTSVAPLTREELSVLPSTSRLPNTADVNADSLPALLGEAFDVNSSDRSVARASRDLLTTQEDLDLLNRELLDPSTSDRRKELIRDVYIPQTTNMRYLLRRDLLDLAGQ